jgi:hypothetical protein
MSDLNLKIEACTNFTPDKTQKLIIDYISSLESVISGKMGSMFTPQQTPDSVNLLITLEILSVGGVPGSIRRLICSLQVVIDQIKQHLSLYFS